MNEVARNQSSSLRRALAIVEHVRRHGGGRGVSLTALAEALEINKSTILRLAIPLQDAGLLVRDADSGRFRLGLGALRLGQAYLSTLDLRRVAAGRLHALQESCGHTCHLVVPDGTYVVYIDKVEDSDSIRMASRIGSRAPMYRTAVGQAMLAWLGGDAVEEVVAAGMPATTGSSITSGPALRAELARVAERGYAVDDGQNEPDVRCVAAPIFDHDASIAGALSISALAWRLTPDLVAWWGSQAAETARQISHELGCLQEPSRLQE